MATAVAGIDQQALSDIRSKLQTIPEVLSIAYRSDDGLVSFWIGVPECDHAARKSIYAVEDLFADRFGVRLEFNLVTLAPGESLRRYISTAAPIYQRAG
ncbi:MAG TPA: hypothetical protein VGG15_03210 [Terriglobales bacterium]